MITQKLISAFIGRQYFRLQQGAGGIGLLVSAIMWVVTIYGVWKDSLRFYDIQLIPFAVIGFCFLFSVYWVWGFVNERIGLYREIQDHMNRENNPQWTDAYKMIREMHESMKVSK